MQTLEVCNLELLSPRSHILWCQGHIHEYDRPIDDLEVQRAMNESFGDMHDCGFRDNMLLPFLTQGELHFGIKVSNIHGVGPIKMEELVEVM